MFSSTAIDGLITIVSDEAMPLGLVQTMDDGALSTESLMRLADAAFEERDWASAASFYLTAIKSRAAAVDYQASAIKLGRSLLYARDFGAAARILEMAAEYAPDHWDARFYCGRALQYLGDYESALEHLTIATILRADRAAGFLALAETAHALAFGGYGVAAPAGRDMSTMAQVAYRRAIDLDAGQLGAHLGLIRLAGEQRCLSDALAAYGAGLKILEDKTNRVERLHIEMASVCCRFGAYDQARALLPALRNSTNGALLARRIDRLLAHVPSNSDAAAEACSPLRAQNIRWFVNRRTLQARVGGAIRLDHGQTLSGEISLAQITSIEAEYIAIGERIERAANQALRGSLPQLDRAFGGVSLAPSTKGSDPGCQTICVRRTLLIELLMAEEAQSTLPLSWAAAYELVQRRVRLLSLPGATSDVAVSLDDGRAGSLDGDTVVLLSRSGYQRAGGGDQFLHEAGGFYATAGAKTITLGIETVGTGEITVAADGTQFAYLPEDATLLRSWLLANRVTMLHTMSGLGQTVIEATDGLNIKLIYGVHHWREFVLSPIAHPYCFPSIGQVRSPVASPEFRAILSRFDHVYVNSDYVRDIATRLYHVDLPIVPSLVRDDFASGDGSARDDRDRAFIEQTLGRDFVLLANARHDKGFSLIIEVAARLPHIPFVVIASQSQGNLALRAVHRRGLTNVKVIERVRDMRALYQSAKLVAVPSHEFTETFGRVAIEASRFGKPVLMADNGNLVNLSTCDEDLLADDPADWAAAIAAIYGSPKIYAHHCAASERRSKAFAADRQHRGFDRIVKAVTGPRILVAVGSGIGNICHTTPLIRALSERFGMPIDVLMCGDHDGSTCVAAGAPWVGTVFETITALEDRAYDLALITHSYGSVTPRLNAQRVLESRAIAHFDPGGVEHEAAFNLSVFAPHIDGLDAISVANKYFLGGWRYRRPGGRRVAFHAGSKKGNWTTKRWPYFAELGAALRARGYEVTSVGTADELVPGTVDLTDGPIEDMIDRLTSCDLVVSNDSGVMNLANALGIPLVALFGPTNVVTRGPLRNTSRIVAVESDCSPCEASPTHGARFKAGTCDCMRAIGVAPVLAAALELLEVGSTAAKLEASCKSDERLIA